MSSHAPSPPSRGRPRDPRTRAAILAAARVLLEPGRLTAATIAAIAAQTGVPRARRTPPSSPPPPPHPPGGAEAPPPGGQGAPRRRQVAPLAAHGLARPA